MSNFRDWAKVELKTKPDWKKPAIEGLAFIGACALVATVLVIASY
jgi:hypothetical protein